MYKRPRLQAHRGVSTEYPENTMAAFRAAVEQGYDVIELDPNYTADCEIVVLHDSSINRTARKTNGALIEETTEITGITYEEARTYDFGVYFAEKFAGERIPLLEQALTLAGENGIRVKIDNKIEAFSGEASEKLYELLKKHEPCIGITTGRAEMIHFYAKRFPAAELHYDGPVDETVLKELAAYESRLTVWLPYRSPLTSWVRVPFADEALCETVKKYAKLGIWIINDQESYDTVCERYSPDIVETTGAVKPE